jgi:hypothetical protein
VEHRGSEAAAGLFMTAEVERFRAELQAKLRADTRRFTILAICLAAAGCATGAGLVVLVAHLADRL